MSSVDNSSARLSASYLKTSSSSSRTHSFTSLNSDVPSFHTAHASSPIDVEERQKFNRSPSPLLLRSTTPTIPTIPTRTSSQLSTSNTSIKRTTKITSPIPPLLRSSTSPNLGGTVTRSPSKRSHTPSPYAVSQKMERADSGFGDGHLINAAKISSKGRKSPLSAERGGPAQDMDKIKSEGENSGTSSRPAASRASGAKSSPPPSKTDGNVGWSPSNSARHSNSTSKRALPSSSTTTPQRPLSKRTSPSYQLQSATKSHFSYPSSRNDTPEVQECRLSNLRQRHCFYQFPPLPPTPPKTGHAATTRKGSFSGEEYAIPPPNHPYHQSIYDTTPTNQTISSQTLPARPIYHPHSYSLDLPNRTTQSNDPSPHPDLNPPPQTTLYFLTPETRRLEYAAIDAASRGLRGLVSKLVPDCMLPKPSRAKFFNEEEGGDGSDAGSVRRYRLPDMNGEGREVDRKRSESMSEDSGWVGEGKDERLGGKRWRSGWRRWLSGIRDRRS